MYIIKTIINNKEMVFYFNDLNNEVYKSLVRLGLPIYIRYIEYESELRMELK